NGKARPPELRCDERARLKTRDDLKLDREIPAELHRGVHPEAHPWPATSRLACFRQLPPNRAEAGEERVARLHACGVDEAARRASRLVRGAPAARPYRRGGDRRDGGIPTRRRHL